MDLDGRADKRPSQEAMSAGDALAGEFGSDRGERGAVLGIALANWLFRDVLPTFSELAALGPGAHSRKRAEVATPERSKGGKGTSGSQGAVQGRTSDVGTVGNDHSRVTPRVEQRSEASRWFDLTSHAPDAASVETSKRLSAGDVDAGAHSATPSAGVGVVDAREATASKGAGKAHGHHSDPKFMGGDPTQPLTTLPEGTHKGLHKDMNNFLQQRQDAFRNHMRPQRGNSGPTVQRNFTRQQRLEALGDFYRDFGDKYPDAARDFFNQHPGL